MSTKAFDRSHLTTGHTFSVVSNVGGVKATDHWICLSPACDMVPGQKSEGWHERLGNSIPFVAVRLFPIGSTAAVKNATRNTVLFLEIDKTVQSFSIYRDASVAALPEWEQMFAANLGRFSAGEKITLTSILGTGDLLRISVAEATVTAQLRSEYALNLLQRIGGQLSRSGLGMHFKGRTVN